MKGELLLPFSDPEREERHLPHFEHPRNDNERLLNCQYEWLVNQDQKAWADLWRISRQMARKIILTFAKKKGLKLDRFTVEDKTDEAVVYILRRYSKGWYVRKAYHLVIKEGVVHALFHRTKAQQIEQLVDEETMARLVNTPAEDQAVYIEGMTKEEAVAKIRAEFLPEIAERILEKIQIIGDRKMKWWYETTQEEEQMANKEWHYPERGEFPEVKDLNVTDRVVVAVKGCPYVQAGYYDYELQAWYIDGNRYPVPVYSWHYDKPPREKA